MSTAKDNLQNQFRIFDHLANGIFLLNDSFEVIYWNTRLEDWTGISKKDIIGKEIKEFYPNVVQDKVKLRLQTVFSGGPPVIFSSQIHQSLLSIKISSTENQIQHITVSSVWNDEKQCYFALFDIQDITELTKRLKDYRQMKDKALEEIRHRRFTEEKLKISEEHVRALLNATKDEAILIDVHGRILTLNERFANRYNQSVEKLINQDIFSIMSSNIIDKRWKSFVEVVKSCEPAYFEDEDEGRIFGHSLYPVFDDNHKVKGLAIFMRDITDSHIMSQEVIQAKEDAEKANEIKSEFIANISHELRTPLNSILGFCQIINQSDFTLKEIKNFINKIERSGSHLLELINDVLDLSKLESGKLDVDKKEINLRELLKEIWSIIDPQIQNEEVKFDIIVKDDNPEFIFTDELKLKQILFNLISNSIKNTSKGTIEVEVNRVAPVFYYDDEMNYIMFRIRDTGTGIPENIRNKLFDSFVQGTTNKKTKGTGLGLSISKKLVHYLGGKIWFDSKIDEGTSFYFTIRIDNKAEQELSSEKSQKKILVADDDNVVRENLSSFLSKVGYKVDVAIDGDEAISQYEKAMSDLVLLDIGLPKKSGLEVIKTIRKRYSNQSVKIIGMLAFDLNYDKKIILDIGCNDVLVKPINIKVLEEKIHEQLFKVPF